jgi:hypothetical protein
VRIALRSQLRIQIGQRRKPLVRTFQLVGLPDELVGEQTKVLAIELVRIRKRLEWRCLGEHLFDGAQ